MSQAGAGRPRRHTDWEPGFDDDANANPDDDRLSGVGK
jgi:hypothetical protein